MAGIEINHRKVPRRGETILDRSDDYPIKLELFFKKPHKRWGCPLTGSGTIFLNIQNPVETQ